MSLGRKFVAKQIGRLAGTEYFGALTEEAVIELQRALSTSPNEIIAADVINEWLETHSDRPTPADLYRLIRAREPKPQYWEQTYPEPEPLTDEEREEIAALQRRIELMAETKKLRGRAIARGA